jgi:hypothetical protein
MRKKSEKKSAKKVKLNLGGLNHGPFTSKAPV